MRDLPVILKLLFLSYNDFNLFQRNINKNKSKKTKFNEDSFYSDLLIETKEDYSELIFLSNPALDDYPIYKPIDIDEKQILYQGRYKKNNQIYFNPTTKVFEGLDVYENKT